MDQTPRPDTPQSGTNHVRTPGEVLAAARLRQGLSLEQLAERTKIPAPVLAAIERDEYHLVSGPLYVKSFLRTCAAEVGADPDEILDLYSAVGGDPPQVGDEGQPQVWRDAEVKVERIGLPWPRILGIALAVIILAGIALVFVFKDRPRDGARSSNRGPVGTEAATAGPALPGTAWRVPGGTGSADSAVRRGGPWACSS